MLNLFENVPPVPVLLAPFFSLVIISITRGHRHRGHSSRLLLLLLFLFCMARYYPDLTAQDEYGVTAFRAALDIPVKDAAAKADRDALLLAFRGAR